uniref:Metalloendopeptidase n=1 Tax=Romanomermis culicivorax TaxID=13658 RepID=A0A915JA44_ROMCU
MRRLAFGTLFFNFGLLTVALPATVQNATDNDEIDDSDIIPKSGSGRFRSISNGTTLWEKVVPYYIDPAIKQFNKYLKCVRFIEKRPQDTYFVHVIPSGQQSLTLADYCGLSGTMHEMMHTLGFMHENQRDDSGKYLNFHRQNLKASWQEGQVSNPLAIKENWRKYLPYDYGSLMHYFSTAFAKPGTKTITVKHSNKSIEDHMGHGSGFSACDIYKMNFVYGCKQYTDRQRQAMCRLHTRRGKLVVAMTVTMNNTFANVLLTIDGEVTRVDRKSTSKTHVYLNFSIGNPMEERPSNKDNWKMISLHGDSIPQLAYSRRQFDELEINFGTKTATSMESRNWLMGRVYMQLLSEKLNDDADFNGTLMDGGSYGFSIKMPMRSFDKLAKILLLHNLPDKSYIDACTKFVNTSQLATCDNSVLQDVAKYIASFYSQAKPYVKATGRIESKEVVHCHRKILRKLLLGGEQMEIEGISNYIINERDTLQNLNGLWMIRAYEIFLNCCQSAHMPEMCMPLCKNDLDVSEGWSMADVQDRKSWDMVENVELLFKCADGCRKYEGH